LLAQIEIRLTIESGRTKISFGKQRKEEKDMEKKFLSVRDLAMIAIFVALIIVCTWITIPLGPVPFTLQTFAICVTGGVLGLKRGTIAVVVYILLGIVGVPVFSEFSSGVVKFIPNTETGMLGGFILGFIFTVIIVGIFKYISRDKETKIKTVYLGVGMVLGDFACLIFGTIWFWQFNPMHMGLAASISACVIPFIIPDLAKIIVALIVSTQVNKYLNV